MLAPQFRVWVQNESGVTANVTCKYLGKKIDSNGALEYEGSATTIYTNAALATGSGSAGSAVVNTTAKNLEGDVEITAILGGSPSGDVRVYAQSSIDGGTTWDENGTGRLLASINFQAAGTKVRVPPIS